MGEKHNRRKMERLHKKYRLGDRGKCGKIVYYTLEKVDQVLKECKENSKYNEFRRESRYYWCSKCRGYHLTSKETPYGR